MKKKLLLILLSLSLTFTMFACGGGGNEPCDECVDEDGDGFCDVCDEVVESDEHVCRDRKPKDAECDICGEYVPCKTCVDENPKDAVCDVCGEDVECEKCIDKSPKDAVCDVCGKEVPCKTHTNDNEDSKCDVCGKVIPVCATHVDDNDSGKCDICGKTIEVETHTCVDSDPKDARCDICGSEVACAAHVNANEDRLCDVCGKTLPVCQSCKDLNKNAKCDVCGSEVPCVTCVDEDPKNARCDVCGKEIPCVECIDENPKNAKCDVCGKTIPCVECIDENPKNAKCDVCGKDVLCTKCVDEDDDGKCDVCKNDMPAPTVLKLIEDTVPNFQFVLASNIDIDTRRTLEQTIIPALKNKSGIEVKCTTEGRSDDVEMAIEVLIGDVTSRGEDYIYDRYSLGNKGYVIKIVGTKIIIHGGSDAMICSALLEFAEDILDYNSRGVEFAEMSEEQNVEKPQTGYKVTSLSVNGADMKGYVIATDLTLAYYKTTAENIRATMYERTGYWFNIVPIENAPEKAIIIKHIPKVTGDESYKIHVDGEKLVIDCAYDNMLNNATTAFLLGNIASGSGAVNFTDTVYTQDISVVYYEDFEAKGDGKTDDFKALYLTHVFANECGQTVVATKGKTYYIKSTKIQLDGEKTASPRSIPIQTNVIWTGASFMIDDFELSVIPGSDTYDQYATNIFKIIPDDDLAVITITDREVIDAVRDAGIKPGITNIQIPKEAMAGWEGEIMIIPYNSSHKIYRRKNYGSYNGADMHEVIVLDKDGNVSDETPIAFEYTEIDKILVYRLDESTAITVEGGTITTRASNVNVIYDTTDNLGNPKKTTYGGYINRGIYINRSYTTLKNIKHLIEDEIKLTEQTDGNGNIIKCGACYQGFYAGANANHVTLDGCTMTGRRCFPRPEGGTGGTYDIGANRVNVIVFKNCIQSNFWVTIEDGVCIPADRDTPNAVPSMSSYDVGGKSLKMHWGVGGTNFCKNMQYIGSTLSRFDAHEGLYNGKIIDSTVNYMAITGKGEFEVTNVNWYAEGTGYGQNSLIHLREDYGSTWDGPITITNVNAYIYPDAQSQLVYHNYTNWYRGYDVAFPSLSITNLDYYNIRTYKPLEAGHEIYLVAFSSSANQFNENSKMHLAESHTSAWLSMEDKDPDGICDRCGIEIELKSAKCKNCVNTDGDHFCDVCGLCYKYEDLDKDNMCDTCHICRSCTDKGDGYIDIPFDVDKDGVIGNSPFKYDEIHATLAKPENGYLWSGNYTNFCLTKPPEYVKIFDNDGVDGAGGYVFKVYNTGKNADNEFTRVSNGGYWGVEENWGGFFGSTKFYYTETDYFQGTSHVGQTETPTFLFYE